MEFLSSLSPCLQTLILTLGTWLFTSLGSAMVFFVKKTNKPLINFLLSFSAGIMIASSVFSLIIPALETETLVNYVWCSLGVLFGGLFVICGDVFLSKIISKTGRFKSVNKRNVLLIFAISLHNIPEGMSIGVIVASLCVNSQPVLPAVILAFGIAVQNFPEGASVSLPLINQNVKKGRAFICGVFSGIVEPIFAIVGCLFALTVSNILPFLLTFSAGTMICVSCTELISEATNYNKNLASLGLIFGFFVMMILDLLL